MNQHTVKAYGDELNQITAEIARMGGGMKRQRHGDLGGGRRRLRSHRTEREQSKRGKQRETAQGDQMSRPSMSWLILSTIFRMSGCCG